MSGSQFEMDDLFDGAFANGVEVEKLAEGAMLFRCFAPRKLLPFSRPCSRSLRSLRSGTC